MGATDDQQQSELGDLLHPERSLLIKVVGVEVSRLDNVHEVTIYFATRYFGQLMYGHAEYPLEIDDESEVERLVHGHPLGSYHLLTTRYLELYDSEIYTWFPEMKPLSQTFLAKHQQELAESFLPDTTGYTPPQRLLPDILRPAVKTLAELSCGTIVAEHLLQKIEGFLRADGGSWYSVRCSDPGNDVVALLERVLASFATQLSEQSPLSEVLIHIVSPTPTELLCLVNLDSRIRAVVGGHPRLFIGANLGTGPECTVAMIGRCALPEDPSEVVPKLADKEIQEYPLEDTIMVNRIRIIAHRVYDFCNEVHIDAVGYNFCEENLKCELYVVLPEDPHELCKMVALLEKQYPPGSCHRVESRTFKIDEHGVTFYDYKTKPVKG